MKFDFYYKNNYYIVKNNNKLIFKQINLNYNNNFTYIYIIHILYKIGYID